MMIQPELLGRILRLAEIHRRELPAPAERVQEPGAVAPVRPYDHEGDDKLAGNDRQALIAARRAPVEFLAAGRTGERPAIAAGTTPGLVGTAVGTPADPAVAARLSATGRLVAQLAGGAPADAAVGAPSSAAPALAAPPADTARVAAVLRELIASSGLFYEAHQAEWVRNVRDLGTLLREPQGRHSPALAPPAARAESAAPPSASAASSPSAATAAATPAADSGEPPLPIHPDTAPLIRQQLTALETRHIAWAGEIWPGQVMHWEIEEDRHGAAEGEVPAPERTWHTRLELALPRLGHVTARITLNAGALTVRLAMATPAADALAQSHAADLCAAFAAAGLPPASIVRGGHGAA